MNIVTLLEEIKALPNCKLHRPCGLPKLRPEHVLPEDLRIFYEHCGGFTWNQMVETTLWSSFSVLPPQQVSLANPLIAFVPQSARESCPDISWDWYVIAHNSDRDYFTIDLHPARLGRCYDSFYEIHASPGNTPILGFSFNEFLARMLRRIKSSEATNWDWEGNLGSLSLGDAYH